MNIHIKKTNKFLSLLSLDLIRSSDDFFYIIINVFFTFTNLLLVLWIFISDVNINKYSDFKYVRQILTEYKSEMFH